ncbi:MAG: TonB-dependent receptor plug domain-containing protein [Prolixibacteraceae bacterium]|jgi:TonB-dependent SusC/RagA subfamily outer membrane receptor|nr:TonB-dependent receptor plug domain-containing protein [Prolixibacteraceae bacterium]MBT6766141.1 TonB-dependent receptor plug domain-containing protein [Prolixibacteraceae bacterium]MBT6996933.1 TonB-dependent receptor plug domain-containing protein [Prolixibacteraceae bacterium]MBT7395383.1 TonB-dependent receptor plug domain-containing protein [Prolixibacteraceae bacterium]
MKLTLLKFSTLLFAFFYFSFSNAQVKVIHGMVTAFDSIPLVGVEIKVKSNKLVTHTDELGKFSVSCSANDKLRISANGFYADNIKLSEKIKLVAVNLKLKPGDKNKDYALGYTHVSDKDKFNSLISLNEDDTDFSQYNNIYELISGRFAGVQVMKSGEIIIRGVGSFSLNNGALIVLNGVPYNNANILNSIHPTQVKSINIIKDGKSAMYGARGSNGVVVIETKTGEEKVN